VSQSSQNFLGASLLLAMARHRTVEREEARKLMTETASPVRALMESSSGKWTDDIIP